MGIGYLHYLVTLRYKNGISIKCNQFYCTINSSKVTRIVKREWNFEISLSNLEFH